MNDLFLILLIVYLMIGSYLAGAMNEKEENSENRVLSNCFCFLLFMLCWWLLLISVIVELYNDKRKQKPKKL